MKAIIMAGGEGSRLRPLTCDCPKPMLHLLGKPMMEYAIELLKHTGIRQVGATLGYLPEAIREYFGDGEDFGVSLRYYIETSPLGTAGSVGQARDFLDETFLVLSGDGVTDLDLAEAIEFHRQKEAVATLVLCRCPDPQEYGMVVTDADGRIRSFHEKPGRCDVYSDRINTGIYILEPRLLSRIPEDRPCDFGHDLFPALVREGLPVYGYTAEGYWCDVGDVGAYLRVHEHAMEGGIHLPGLASTGIASEGAVLEEGCVLRPPCRIAPGTRVCRGAQVGPYASIGPGCAILPGASVKHSVLFDGVHVGAGAQLRGCVLASGAQVGEGAQLYEESVVGSRSVVGDRAILPPGVKLWPEKAVPDGERAEANVVWGSRREQRFVGGALQLTSPAQASRAAEAIIAETQPREVLIGRSGSTVATAMWHAVAAGAMAQGAQVIDAGVCSPGQLRHARQVLQARSALLVREDALLPLNQLGAILPEKRQRAILKLCERQDHPGPFVSVTRPMESAGTTDIAYIAFAAAGFRAAPHLAPPVALCASDSHLLSLAERAFLRAGMTVRCEWDVDTFHPEPGELGILLSPGGGEATFFDSDGPLDEAQRQLAVSWTLLEEGCPRLLLPVSATRAIDALAADYGAHSVYLPGDRAAWMNQVAEADERQLLLQCDGLCFALAFLSRLTEKGLSLAQWRRMLPSVYRFSRRVPLPQSRSGQVLHSLAEESPAAEMGGGLRLPREDGWAFLSPEESGAELQIIAEATDMETAEGMCDFYEGRLKQLMETVEK